MAPAAPLPLHALSAPDLYRLAAQLRAAIRPEPAEAALRELLRREPQDPQVRFALAYLLLARGAFAEAWPLYEARSDVSANKIRRPAFSFPEWRGESVGSILLFPEQGLGDQVFFARYAALLRDRGVQVTMIAPAPLARLFETLGVEVIAGAEGLAVPRRDAWAMVGSLPRWLGQPGPAAYLPSQPVGPKGVTGLGIAARGNPDYVKDAQRSLPPDLAAELMALPGAVSLHPEDTGAPDLQATAELISGLERVITVDTAVAHLAGAMGKPVFVVLSHDPDWRWGWSGETTAWYPSARLFRQSTPGDWRPVLDAVQGALGG
ncbi:glycosyltransferase family 9 protein [Phenylobacterium sp.]|uniref:glycosyltransferase family 9 protein n=1 Tax=Phenylobacterium sp. TaxID=1871053 RepID=UPI002DE39FF0|nr:glycosyltransferase family 9 protein [Phenylobacterium sp.]